MTLADKTYEVLKPNERLSLALAAVARKDIGEFDRLFDTCQQKNYRMPDQDFAHPLKTFAHMANEHRAEVLGLALGVSAVLHIIAYREDLADETEACDDAYDKARSALKANMHAWETFCREDMGLNDEEFRAFTQSDDDAFEPLNFMLAVFELETVDPEPTVYGRALDRIRSRWGRAQ